MIPEIIKEICAVIYRSTIFFKKARGGEDERNNSVVVKYDQSPRTKESRAFNLRRRLILDQMSTNTDVLELHNYNKISF